jgi:hypothetical protein
MPPDDQPPKPTMTLCDFLLARLKEVNSYASRTTYSIDKSVFRNMTFIYDRETDDLRVFDVEGIDVTDSWTQFTEEHAGPADPRLVRMAAAQAKIVHRYQRTPLNSPTRRPIERVLRDLASVWSDHPDYNWKWR